MGASVFISYGHNDQLPTDWLARLREYLACLRRGDTIDVWDDSRIKPGSEWRDEIGQAIGNADAAILLVGPAFLASDYVATRELPVLLSGAETRNLAVFPLITRWCPYRASVLEPYQAFNSIDEPLESLPPPEQNRVLNELAMAVEIALRGRPAAAAQVPQAAGSDLCRTMSDLQRQLASTRTAFQSQIRLRQELRDKIEERLDPQEYLQHERFFFRYFPKMDREEAFLFAQIRALTEGLLQEGNQAALDILQANPALMDEVPGLVGLRQHLVVWLNKYDRVFAATDAMCLLYVGVEEGVPFPLGLDRAVQEWVDLTCR